MSFRRRRKRKATQPPPAVGPGENAGGRSGGEQEETPQPAEASGPAEPSGPAETPGPSEPSGPSAPDSDEEGKGPFASTRAALAPIKKRHVLVATIGLMGFTAVGVLLFSAASFWWTSQPSFCGRCHVMEPYITAWEQSPHADVNCESCHLTPGFFGFIGGKIAGLQVVANYIRGDYEDWSFNAAVSNAACLQCHEEITEASIHDVDTGILVSHRDILESGGKCMFCHSTVAHGSAVATGSATHPTMQTCLTCHNDEIAPLDCGLCHVGKKPQGGIPEETSPTGTGG
jgi:cytochrome c nitrite reductase small subunit